LQTHREHKAREPTVCWQYTGIAIPSNGEYYPNDPDFQDITEFNLSVISNGNTNVSSLLNGGQSVLVVDSFTKVAAQQDKVQAVGTIG
jgi:hypothetical protein